MIFIDTNFFLRFFLKDIENQYLEAKKIFKAGARREEELTTSLVVIFEIFWVLSSTYNYKREEVSQIMHAVLQMTFINLEERILLWEALELFDATNLSLGDCYNMVFARENNIKDFKTFDIKLGKEFENLTFGS